MKVFGAMEDGILVRPGKKGRKIRKRSVLATVEYTEVNFFCSPLSSTGRIQGAGVIGVTGRLVLGRRPLACLQPRFHL